MTDKIDREIMQQALDALIENARLLGITQAKRGYGFYSQEDAIFERALHECIAKHSAVLRERLAQPDPLQRFTDVQQEIEAALTPEQDPVAYVLRTLSSKSISDEIAPTGWSTFESKIEKLRADPWVQNGIAEIVPLYTSPQQPEWQGLTEEEIIIMSRYNLEYAALIGEVQGKLKEKNT
jgi:hypothetical protein